MKLSKREADAKILNTPLKWGKYAVIKWYAKSSLAYRSADFAIMNTASGGYMYSEIWSAKAFGIINKGLETPNKNNDWCYSAVVNVQTGKIEWRNYAD